MDGSQQRTEFAQKQRSISGHRDEEDGPSSWDSRRPPLGGTEQAQLGGDWKLLLGTNYNIEIISQN